MKRGLLALLSLTTAATAVIFVATALAAPGAGHGLSWWTVDGGGGTTGGSGYTLSGTAGQPDAETLEDGGYTLSGGFWGGAGPVEYAVYLPLVLRTGTP